jgi:hypothetical protein
VADERMGSSDRGTAAVPPAQRVAPETDGHDRQTERSQREPERRHDPVVERTGEGEIYYTVPRSAMMPAQNPMAAANPTFVWMRDRIRWGPILGGLLSSLTLLFLFELLGLAIGLSAFGSGADTNTVAWYGGIWSAASGFLAFLIGGWVAGKTSAVENFDNALLNGFLVGAAGIILLVWMAAAGVSNVFGLLGGGASNIVHSAATDPNGIRNALNDPSARNSAWFALASVVIGLVAAMLGSLFGRLSWHGFDWGSSRTARHPMD